VRKIKKESGITMAILVITIVILTIISGIVIKYSINGISYSIEKKLLADLETVQHAVYEQYEHYKITKDADLLKGVIASNEEKSVLTSEGGKWIETDSSGAPEDSYYKLTSEDLKEIGVKNSKDEYIVNYKTGECFNLTKKRTKENNHLLYIN